MPCPTQALSAVDIEAQLKALPHWQLKDKALERTYTGKTYLAALEILNRIAQLSETADHHPDLSLHWKKLTLRYWTHTAQGVTELDFQLAHQVEAMLGE